MNGEPQSRRNFLRMMIGGIAAGAAVRTFPFRVFSFPFEIVKPQFIKITMQQNFRAVYDPTRHVFNPIWTGNGWQSVDAIKWDVTTMEKWSEEVLHSPRDTNHETRI
jgi:hypothetical protein